MGALGSTFIVAGAVLVGLILFKFMPKLFDKTVEHFDVDSEKNEVSKKNTEDAEQAHGGKDDE